MNQRHLVNLIADWLEGYGDEPVTANLAAQGIRENRWAPSGTQVCQWHGFHTGSCVWCDLDTARSENHRLRIEKIKESELVSLLTAEQSRLMHQIYSEQLEKLREGVRGFALTLRDWAVRAGGHTPSAIIASRLLELIGDEKAPPPTEADVVMKES